MDAQVPCGNCNRCCKGPIMLHPSLGDDPAKYGEAIYYPGVGVAIRAKGNGDCAYRSPIGCDIYEDRPALCRAFDCRVYAKAKWTERDPMKDHDVIKRGLELLGRQNDDRRTDSTGDPHLHL